MITQEELHKLILYDPKTGLWKWLVRDTNRKAKDWFEGTKTKLGYRSFQIKAKSYMAHRLAWLYMTGEWPSNEIDHKNRVRHDNRWENLREVTKNVNMQNQATPHKNNKSGYLGVQLRKNGKYYAEIKYDKQRVFLGVFLVPEEASAAYLQAKEIYHS